MRKTLVYLKVGNQGQQKLKPENQAHIDSYTIEWHWQLLSLFSTQ